MSLSKQLDNELDYKGILIKLNLAFNNVLLYYQLNQDEAFEYNEKIEIGFNMLCNVNNRANKRLSINDKANILKTINESFLNANKRPYKKDSKKVFDFSQDSDLIYSSFMQQYGIDLYNEIDKLDWRKFVWLLHGLGTETKLQKVIDIRTRPIPTRTKHNCEEIKALIEAKAIYALEMSEEERAKQFTDSLKSFAKKLIGKG